MNNKAKFDTYALMLRQWSGRMNLVAPSTLNDIENRHFADSAQLADVLPRDAEIIDLGSGAGFPGIVLEFPVHVHAGLRRVPATDFGDFFSKKHCQEMGICLHRGQHGGACCLGAGCAPAG